MARRRFLLVAAGAVLGACTRRSTAAPPVSRHAPQVGSGSIGTPKYVAKAKAWLVAVPERVKERALALLPEDLHKGVRAGLVALSEKCPFEKMELVYCESSRWFECPNCGSRFSLLGDKHAGPAPTGMHFYAIDVSPDEDVSIVSEPLVKGLPYDGPQLISQPAEGPPCV